MRRITDHITNPVNDRLGIAALDERGPGGANHHYEVDVDGLAMSRLDIHFQKGAIAESGINGVTQEVLLAIVIDRLRGFQAGPYPCRENAIALTKCEEALHWLQSRTRARMERGVEGRSVV